MCNNSKIEVLLVDDEEGAVRSLILGLERGGIKAIHKDNPQDALQVIKDNPERFDVIIMDQVFPPGNMDGIEATKQIKAQWPNLHVLVLTGYAAMGKGIEALRAGAYDYIAKPPDFLELETHIRYAAERKRLIITAAEKERLSKAIEKMGDEVIVIDRNCNIILANQAKKNSFGEDMEGQKCYHVFEGEDKLCDGCPTLRCIKENRIIRTPEWPYHHPLDDKDYVVDITSTPLMDEFGVVYGAIEVCRDVTNRIVLDSIGEKIQATLDFNEICRIMAENLPRLRYDRARLYLKEGNLFKGVQPVFIPEFGAMVIDIQSDPPSSKLLELKSTLIFRVLPQGDERIGTFEEINGGKIVYTDCDPCKEKLNRDVNEWLEIPLITADEIIGKISIDNNERKRPIEEYDLPMMALFGRYVANAIWNAQTHRKLQAHAERREKEQEALRQADGKILESLRPQEMLNTILQEAQELIPFNCAIIRQREAFSREFKIKAKRGEYKGKVPESVEEGIGISGECARTKERVVVHLRERIPKYQELLRRTKDPKEKIFLTEWIGSGVAVPLMIGGELIGILAVLKHEENGFTDENQILLLEDFAGRAAIALKYSELLEANYNLISFEAHALKNRIQAIRAIAGWVKSSEEDIDYVETFDDLDSEMKRFSNAVNTILHTATWRQAEKLNVDRQPVDLQKFLEDTTRTFKYIANVLDIRIEKEIKGDIGSVSFDERMVLDAGINLIDNAIKYSKGTEIVVSAHREGEYLTISVSDNGVGIEEDEQKMVFDMFYRTKSVKKRGDGSGIGLTFVKAVAEAHDGKVWLEPKPQKGTKVYMTLKLESQTGA